MSAFELLKILHISCAVLSAGGFAVRGFWMVREHPLLRRRLAKTLPHIVDTLLLGSAVGMLIIWQTSPFTVSWLTAKILALMLYIALGMIALRFGKTKTVRIGAWLAALLTVLYIASVAFTKSPWGFFGVF